MESVGRPPSLTSRKKDSASVLPGLSVGYWQYLSARMYYLSAQIQYLSEINKLAPLNLGNHKSKIFIYWLQLPQFVRSFTYVGLQYYYTGFIFPQFQHLK